MKTVTLNGNTFPNKLGGCGLFVTGSKIAFTPDMLSLGSGNVVSPAPSCKGVRRVVAGDVFITL